MKQSGASKIISIGGILSAIAVVFQLSPVFLPVIGMMLSALSTFPVVLAAVLLKRCAYISYLSSAAVLFSISPRESVIFLFITGMLGLAIGLNIEKKFIYSVIISSVTLFIGLNILSFAVGITAFGKLLNNQRVFIYIIASALFSVTYSTLWILIIKKFFRLKTVKVLLKQSAFRGIMP